MFKAEALFFLSPRALKRVRLAAKLVWAAPVLAAPMVEAPKRSGQVAVFVSRKEKKIFVRQGFVPLFDMPIEIVNPDRPLGTHLFTALELQADKGWTRVDDFVGIRRDRVVAQSQIRRPDEKEYHGGRETAEGYAAPDDIAPAAAGRNR